MTQVDVQVVMLGEHVREPVAQEALFASRGQCFLYKKLLPFYVQPQADAPARQHPLCH